MKDHEALVQHLTPPEGVSLPPYPAQRDRWYRRSLWGIFAGLVLEALGHWGIAGATESGFILTALAVVLAAWTFLVWLRQWRWIVRALAVTGVVAGIWWPIAGWAGLLAAGSVMAAKEHHCFHFLPARLIPWTSLAFGMWWIAASARGLGWGYLVLAILWGWMAFDRKKLPLFEVNTNLLTKNGN